MDDPSPSAAMPSIPGVELVEVIGGGGSGVVYRGRQTTPQRDVAVKVVSSPEAPDDAMDRWQREVSAMGRLSNHPNIVGVHSGGVTDAGQPYLVMPYVPTGTLADRLRTEGPMPPAEVASVGAKLAGALAIAHDAGVLHRDLKPANVLVSPYGEPQLADFGIARLADSSTTAAGTVHATIPYAAPEVLDGDGATEVGDVYGLGATLYACLTGSAPFTKGSDETLVGFVSRIAHTDPPPLAAAGIPPALAAVVERSLAKDPALRHSSAADLQQALEEVDLSVDQPDDTSVFAPAPTVVDQAPVPVSERTAVVPAPVPEYTAPPSPAPASAARDEPANPDRTGGGPGGRGLWAATGIVAVLIVALVAFAATRGGGDVSTDDVSTDDVPSTGEVPATDEPETSTTTEASTTSQEPTTTEAESTTTNAPPTTETTRTAEPTRSTPSDLTTAAVQYIEALDRRAFDDAWARTSPRFQQRMNRASWEGFWGGFDSIDIVGEARTVGSSGAVVIPLSLDGQREDYRLTFVEGDDGSALVDGPVGN